MHPRPSEALARPPSAPVFPRGVAQRAVDQQCALVLTACLRFSEGKLAAAERPGLPMQAQASPDPALCLFAQNFTLPQ